MIRFCRKINDCSLVNHNQYHTIYSMLIIDYAGILWNVVKLQAGYVTSLQVQATFFHISTLSSMALNAASNVLTVRSTFYINVRHSYNYSSIHNAKNSTIST